MAFQKRVSSLLTVVLLCGPITKVSSAQQTDEDAYEAAYLAAVLPPAPATPPVVLVVPDAVLLKTTPPLTEEALRARYVGKVVFLRGAYLGDELSFDKDGNIGDSPTVASFTLSAFEVRSVTLSKKKLEIEADRYGLHYRGGLALEDDGKSYDRVKISDKPVHLSIEREAIVIPKLKKDKKKRKEEAAQVAVAPADAAKAQPVVAPTPETAEALTAAAEVHSAMVMNKALDSIFASDLDARMMAKMPAYWQAYFTNRQQGRTFMPADSNIRLLSDGMTPPTVLNRIDPGSNEFAQQNGIAGMEMVRTVVDAAGVPQQMAISRPIGFGLDEKAVEAVRNSHFKPALVKGQPVPVVIDLVVTFRIYSGRTQGGTKDSQPSVASMAKAGGTQSAALADK